MATRFACGAKEVPKGVSEFSVSALAMPFAPSSVILSVRQPVENAPLISAYLIGKAAADGFKVALSAPVELDGYYLEWNAFSESEAIVQDGDSLALGYSDFFKGVARFLGYDPDSLTDEERTDVDDCVQSGVRNFYWPMVMKGGEWSFLKMEASIATEKDVNSYLLPDGMGNVSGQLHFAPSEQLRSVVIVPFGEIQMMRRREAFGAPRFAAVVATNRFGGKGQMKRLHLYPTPDKAYALSFRAEADCGRLDAEANPYPLGGAAYSEMVMESCLAVAEQRINDEAGIHTQKFNEFIQGAADRDSRSGVQEFGQMGDPTDW